MQLKSLAKTQDALIDIDNLKNAADEIYALTDIGRSYTQEVIKSALAQSTLDKEQIKTILSANGLQGELLETTADELANAASTNAVAASQKKTAVTTLGLGTAFKGLGIKIKKATASLWSFLTTKPAGWATLIVGAMAGAAFAVKKYNDSIAAAKEKARERTDELFDEFQQRKDTLAEHKKTVAELAARYDELSKGVNLSNNKNISLSTNEYEEFLRISEQLADSFPELSSGIDENGNSILTLGTGGMTATEQLEELLHTEEELSNFRIAQGLEDAFKGVYTYIEDAKRAADGLNDSFNSTNERINALRQISENGISFDKDTGLTVFGQGRNSKRENLIYHGDYANEADVDYINTLRASAEDFFESLSDERRSALNGKYSLNPQNLFDIQTNSNDGTFNVYARLIELSNDEVTSLQNIIGKNISTLTRRMADELSDQVLQSQESIQKGENAWKDFIPNLVTGMQAKSTFQSLEPDLQDIAIKIVEGLDSSYADAMSEYDPDPYAYIRDKLIIPMSNLSDSDKKKLANQFTNLFRLDPYDISEGNREKIRIATEQIANILGKTPLEIRTILGFDVNDDAKKRLDSSIQQIARGHGKFIPEEYHELSEYTKNFTASQAELWLEATLGAHDAAEAIQLYEAALAEASKLSIAPPLSIIETVKQIETQLRSVFNSLRSAYQNIFTDDNSKEKQFPLADVDITDSFEPILSELEKLDELDGINIDYSVFDDFVSVLSDTSSTAEEIEEQFNSLATSIIYASDCTKMSSETFHLLAESLSEMGVSNAYEVLESILELQSALSAAGVDATTAMSGEVGMLKDLTIASDETAEHLMAYYIQKQLAENPITTAKDLLQLENLCNALGITGEMFETITALKLAFEAKESGAHAEGLEESIKDYQKRLSELAAGYGSFAFDFDGTNVKSPSSSGSAASISTAETFDWVSQAIEHLEKEIEKLDETANSSFTTFSQKNEALAQEIGKVNEEITRQQQAYDNYMQKADAVGLSDHYKDLAQNGASGMEDISDELLKNQISEYQKWYDKAQEAQDKINSLYEKSKEIHVTSYENCVNELNTLRDNDSISEREYLDRMNTLWESYYADRTEYAVQAKEAKLELLKEEKSYLESVADAAADLLGGQADELKRRQEAEIEILEAKKRPLEAQLELLESQKEEEDRILALQKAQYELKRAEHQRDKLTYVDGQMVYRADETSIRSAKDAVDDAEYNIIKADIKDRIDAYDKEIDKIKERYETEIAGIECLEDEWQKTLALKESALTAGNFESMFGEGSIAKLLSGDPSMITTCKQTYLETLGGIDLTGSGTIGEMTARYAELAGLDLSSITEQTRTVASQFNAVHDAVGRLNASIGSEPVTDVPDGTSREQTLSSDDSLSLSGALQNTYDIASEVLPEEADMLNAITLAANNAAAAIHELKTAISSLSALPLDPDSLAVSGNAYATGTRHAKKGLAMIGEERPEIIITNDQKAYLAKQPTLLHMEGGETVYNGEETAKMLKARGLKPVTPDKFPLLKAFGSYRPSEIRQRFAPQMISPAGTAAASAIQNAGHAVNNSVNNGTSYTTGDVHIHCPGITKDEVAKQIGTELTNVFSGMSLNAYQRANITR